MNKNNVPVKVAAQALGKSSLWVREAIMQNRIDLGACTIGKHGRRSFYISPMKLEALTGFKWRSER